MANVKISNLPAAISVDPADTFVMVQSGVTKQASQANILTTTGDVTAAKFFPTGTSATGTGMYSAAANTIAWSNNGVETMRLDASGNLGIGTSSPTLGKLQVTQSSGTAIYGTTAGGTGYGGAFWNTDGGTNKFVQCAGDGANEVLSAGVGASTYLFLDASGNLGVGTNLPATRLDVRGIANSLQARFGSINGRGLEISTEITGGTTDAGCVLNALGALAGTLIFKTENVERARITNVGKVYIAGTTDRGAYNLQVNNTGVWGAGAYVNGSDERLKEDITTIDTALDVVTALRPVTFRYKETHSKDQNIQPGFIAQELQTALAGKAYVDGVVQVGPEYLSVAYQSLIPLLTKAIQEQQALINDLRARVAALEA